MKRICILFALLILCPAVMAACSSGITPLEEEKQTNQEPVTEERAETTEETQEAAIMQEYDPKEDEELNLLMIGSSSCYYYVEELYGIAKAAGIDMNVCNVYYSGCSLQKHWTWWKQNESNYEFFVTNENGRKKYTNFNLLRCLQYENWDFISLQQSPVRMLHGDLEKAHEEADRYVTDLLGFLREQFPQSKFYWHQTWAWEMGCDKSGMVMDSIEKQNDMADFIKTFALEICSTHDLIRIPSGDAWQLVRHDPVIGENLCERIKVNDHYHDGDIGGGQYLNACVWFEMLTGKSCIGNTWQPDYDLSEAKIAALQEAAHAAVAAL